MQIECLLYIAQARSITNEKSGLALAVAALTSRDAHTARGTWIAMELTGWFAIVPLALGSLLTGLAVSLGTTWGLFRHYCLVRLILMGKVHTDKV